ncbi:MAG: SOUL family heme-binding protein [Chitinophagaceae bacterium]
MSINKTETQAYNVIKVEENFEVRYYPAATMAMISTSSTSYKDLGSSGFSKLAKYIFGGNSDKKQIAMTSPVHMDIGDSNSTMAFVLPSVYNETNLPKPNDSSIAIKTSAPEYVAAIKFGGFADDASIGKYKMLLQQHYKQKAYPTMATLGS